MDFGKLAYFKAKKIEEAQASALAPTKKTVLYSGTPQKTETEGSGTLYVLSADNLLEVTEGQDIYGELVVRGVTHSFVLDNYNEIPALNWLVVDGQDDLDIGEVSGKPTVAYVKELGGTGFGLMSGAGLDIGEISLTLWTEIGGDKPYYITSLSPADGTIPYVNVSNAKEALLRDALYYRNNDDQIGKAVGFSGVGDGFLAVFFITQGGSLELVLVSADSDGVTASKSIIGTT